MNVIPEQRLALFAQMEDRYEKKDVDYFVGLLNNDDFVIRTRATWFQVELVRALPLILSAPFVKNVIEFEFKYSVGDKSLTPSARWS